jgi:hypothetical protein
MHRRCDVNRLLVGLMLSTAAVTVGANDGTTFKDLDTNTDGSVSTTEAGSHQELRADFRAADTNGDGDLSELEFNAWTAQRPTSPTPQPQQTPAEAPPADTPATATP